MKLRVEAPELNDAIEAHARALAGGDTAVAESHASAGALEAYRSILADNASKAPYEKCEVLARAKIGSQFMSKIRLVGRGGSLVLLNRWRQSDDGKWEIAEVDDLSSRRSGWSDVTPLGISRSESRNG
jgi:hypothetical protein